MAVDERDVRQAPEVEPKSTGLGLLKGLGVTLKHALRPSITQQYPQEKPDLPPRTRGVIALKEANCTVCYKCSRECPDWCIYIDAHKETHAPASGGTGQLTVRLARSMKVLDRFAIDYALCMYCGICVEVCPFDALFWSPEFEYSEYDIVELTHEKEKLEEWTYTVLPPPMIEDGAEVPPEAPPAVAPDTAGLAAAYAAAPSAGPAPAAASPAAAPPPVAVPAAAPPTAAAPAAAAAAAEAPAPVEHAEVTADQETYERVLAELLEQGTDRRVAEGRAKRAGMVAARAKAEGGS
jgi:formate hydrogenlyase subunit 6/NADH:ubiquinone oxidoreductase subunit I